jgi:3-(3-hydroxy-phenyl)propionate hydroxylase
VEFDFGVLRNDTRFPYVIQCEQHKLANMTIERLRDYPHACVEFSARVTALEQFDDASKSWWTRPPYLVGSAGRI